jgi:hypothetical protein
MCRMLQDIQTLSEERNYEVFVKWKQSTS